MNRKLWSSRIALIATLVVGSAAVFRAEAGTDCLRPIGTDVIVGDLNGVSNWGSVGDIAAFSVGTTSCNVGDEQLLWEAPNNRHPVIGQNMYHLKNGRFEQVGMSWLKHGFLALALDACGCGCQNPGTGTRLGIGCSDPYSSGLNGQQGSSGTGGLGPRYEVNANTGFFEMPYDFLGDTGNVIFKRLQVHHSDLDPTLDGGGTYFVEGHYVTPDDAAAGNQDNNVSYEQVNVTGGGTSWFISLTGGTHQESPGIQAWQDQEPSVVLVDIDDPEGGHFILAYKVSQNKDLSYHYEYALYNMNSHVSASSFTVPIPDGVVVTNIEFHDVDYHSGEPWDGTDWSVSLTSSEIIWSTDAFATDEFANALRWGTLYNFRFDADTAPENVDASIGLFRPSAPNSITVAVQAPSPLPSVPVGPNATVVLQPPGATCDPAADCTPIDDPLLTLTETCGGPEGVVSAEVLDSDSHTDAIVYKSLGKTFVIDTDLADGCFKATIVMPFALADLAEHLTTDVTMTWYDSAIGGWIPAVCGNTLPPAWCPLGGGFGTVELSSLGDPEPTLAELHARALGAYGVYYDEVTEKGFAWANTNHASDFAAALPLPPIPAASQWGLLVLALAVLTGGSLVLRTQRSVARLKT